MKLVRSLPENYKSFDRDLFPSLGKEITFNKPEINSYKNVLLSGFNLFSINNFQFLNKLSMAIDFNLGTINFSKQMLSYIFKNKKIRYYSNYIWIINDHCFNYYHWTAEALPRLLLLKNNSIYKKVLIPNTWKERDFIFDSLKLLGFTYELYNPQFLNFFTQIISPNHLGSTGNFNPNYMNIVRNELKAGNSENKRFWILRKINQSRYIKNIDNFEKLLKKYNIEKIFSDNLEYYQEIELFSKASFIGGVHGAGLANMIFMDKNSKVLEVKTKNVEKSNAFYAMADSLGLKYYYFRTNSNEDDDGLTLDLEQLENELSTVFKQN